MRLVYLILGLVFLVIGIVGVVTPLLPTTPFLLLAAFFFARSSEKIHNWIMTHPRLGPPILDWQTRGVIRRRAKVMATVLIIANLSFPVLIITSVAPWVKFTSGIAGGLVLLFLWTRPDQ